MGFFSSLSRGPSRERRPVSRGKSGARAYAVGDIHGCLDLLDRLLAKIEQDMAGRPAKPTYIVFLGDLVDRGPASAGVVDRLMNFRLPNATPIFLAGNHEEVFMRVLGGEQEILADWLKFGGAECVQSYGLDPVALQRMESEAAAQLLRSNVPASHLDFIEGFADTFRFGDYLFVHAGIRPGVELAQQDQFDLRWIREPFLSNEDELGLVVVHGHTITPEVDERANRIGVDTGAYQSGILTALCIEDEDRRYLSTADTSGSR